MMIQQMETKTEIELNPKIPTGNEREIDIVHRVIKGKRLARNKD